MLADKSFYTFNQQQTGRKKNTLFKELEKAKIFNRCNTVSHLCVDPIIMTNDGSSYSGQGIKLNI